MAVRHGDTDPSDDRNAKSTSIVDTDWRFRAGDQGEGDQGDNRGNGGKRDENQEATRQPEWRCSAGRRRRVINGYTLCVKVMPS